MDMKKGKNPCIKCDSSDALEVYEDGKGYCFSCKTPFSSKELELGEVGELRSKPSNSEPPSAIPKPANVPSRGLQEATLAYYGVGVEFSEETGQPSKLHYPVFRDGKRTGTKIKTFATKDYYFQGDGKNPDFFGADKTGEGGKLLIITEGEEDAMSAHQMLLQQGKPYNVVSLPIGANISAVKRRLSWLESFETIILNLDNDEIGQAAAKEIADVISPGKVKLMSLPTKDANQFLLEVKDSKKYLKQVYNAKVYRPDGIINLADSWADMWTDNEQLTIPYPWRGLNDLLYGLRQRELVTLTAGTGVGKSAVIRELEHWIFRNSADHIGILALEESIGRTAWGIVSVEANRPLALREERGEVAPQDIKPWFESTLGTGRIHSYDHFGSTSEKDLISRIRYMIKGLGCKWIVLDHLSIVVSAMDEVGDERRAIDSIMTRLRQLCEETGAGMLLVCHLRRVDGNKGHEQGIEVSLSHLRGSQAIAQLSDAVIALERNQQAENEKESNLTTLRVLKNRYAGLTGIATHLAYDRKTGRLEEILNVNEYLIPDEILF